MSVNKGSVGTAFSAAFLRVHNTHYPLLMRVNETRTVKVKWVKCLPNARQPTEIKSSSEKLPCTVAAYCSSTYYI